MEENIIISGDAKGYSKKNLIPIFFIVLGAILALPIILNIGDICGTTDDEFLILMISIALILIIAGIILIIYVNSCEIVVTNKRIYGKAAFGKRVDLPLNSVSAVEITNLFKGIGISTSSGVIKFYYITNAAEIHKVVSDLVVNRNETTSNIIKNESGADELKKYKELLDQGIITKEEFDAKKKKLLDL